MYLYRFETDAEFQSAYKGEDYSEPWVSCTDENHQVNYNYKPHVTIIVRGKTGEKEKTFTLQKYTVVDKNTGDPYSFYYFPISAEELWNMFDCTRMSGDNHIMWSAICKNGVELDGDNISCNGYYLDTHTAAENIAEMNYIKLPNYNGTSTEYFTEFVTSDDERNELGTSFFWIDDRLVDSTISCSWRQVK